MTIYNGKCDNCDEQTDILFPIAIRDKLPSGINQIILKYFCWDCKREIEEEAETMETDEDEDEDEETVKRLYSCGCILIGYEISSEVWSYDKICIEHTGKAGIRFNCGCEIQQYWGNLFKYLKVCVKHVEEK